MPRRSPNVIKYRSYKNFDESKFNYDLYALSQIMLLIILCENDNIINHPNEVANIFNVYFTAIADGIGFDDPIPPGYENDDVLRTMIAKHDTHPSIIAVKMHCPNK